jgi:hypothetical protein
MQLINIGHKANGKNCLHVTKIPLYTVDKEIKAILGNIILTNFVAISNFSGYEINPGAIKIVNSRAKIIMMIVNGNTTQNINENIFEEKYFAPLIFPTE